MTEDLIKKNFETVTEKIDSACRKSARNPSEVQLVVVTKAQSAQKIKNVIQAGAKILGENYAEETIRKKQFLELTGTAIEWHMIGHVQSRKAKLIVSDFDFLHSMDSLKLAKKVNQLLEVEGKKLPVLLQYNVGGEPQKHGWNAHNPEKWHTLLAEFSAITEMKNLSIQGLMTMPPYEEEIENSRKYFVLLRQLRDFLQNNFQNVKLKELSMGTSHDFVVAISEGATYVRVGAAIMGER